MNETADLSAVLGFYGENEASVTDSDIALLQILLSGLVFYHLVQSFAELHTCAVYLAAYSGKLGACSVSYLVVGDDGAFQLFQQPVIWLEP